ncbi:hypothetical protein [Spirosoma sp.]|uniref:coiled-coil domain-containing protein n=1 Tax=Spirosoma sp. TaxID=1899569 RepID=UPI00260856E9|nr:hypothetical protein [Spirosoma sp.]MCX6216574.1 hypothetical protein [Spirosoma sp.]
MQAKETPIRQAPLKITRNEPETDPVLDTLATEEADLEKEAEELERKRTELADKKRIAQEAEYNAQVDMYHLQRTDAQNFRASAAKETDEASKMTYLRWAIEAEKNALGLAQQLGLEIPKELEEASEPKPAAGKNRKWGSAFWQMVGLFFVIFFAYSLFVGYGEHIQKLNEAIPDDKPELKMNPYDATSIQKFFLEKFYEFFDLPLALVKLLIFAPFVLLYILPFFRSKKDFITEFYEDLTPFQRCIITLFLVSLFLLHSALSHLVKP